MSTKINRIKTQIKREKLNRVEKLQASVDYLEHLLEQQQKHTKKLDNWHAQY